MKKSIYYLLFAAITLSLFAFLKIENSNESDFKESFSKVLTSAKDYTLEVAEMMPAEDYSFKPTDSVRTFGEQIAHIGLSTQFIHAFLIKGEEIEFDPVEGKKMEQQLGTSKEECIKQINKTFDEIIASLQAMDENELQKTFVIVFAPDKPVLTNKEGYVFLRDHVTHHRGQAITYLRIKGHKPPDYRAF